MRHGKWDGMVTQRHTGDGNVLVLPVACRGLGACHLFVLMGLEPLRSLVVCFIISFTVLLCGFLRRSTSGPRALKAAAVDRPHRHRSRTPSPAGDGGFPIRFGGVYYTIRIPCILNVSCMYRACTCISMCPVRIQRRTGDAATRLRPQGGSSIWNEAER